MSGKPVKPWDLGFLIVCITIALGTIVLGLAKAQIRNDKNKAEERLVGRWLAVIHNKDSSHFDTRMVEFGRGGMMRAVHPLRPPLLGWAGNDSFPECYDCMWAADDLTYNAKQAVYSCELAFQYRGDQTDTFNVTLFRNPMFVQRDFPYRIWRLTRIDGLESSMTFGGVWLNEMPSRY